MHVEKQQNQQLEANDDQENTHWLQDIPPKPISQPFYWNKKPGATFANGLNIADDKIAYWRKNLFLLPTGATRQIFTTKWRGCLTHGFMMTPM